jgi:hypothetical protein
MMQTNIDDARAEIMRLESAPLFDQGAWAQVLIALSDRPNARANAARRMETAKRNSQYVGGVDRGSVDGDQSVAVETLKAYWVYLVDEEWGIFLHALSVGKAKTVFKRNYPGTDTPEWNDIRVNRCEGADLLDVTPFTDDTLRLAGYPIPRPGDPMYDEHTPDGFLDDCPCSICKRERAKPEMQVGLLSVEAV